MTDPAPDVEPIEDYLDTIRGLTTGIETEIDPKRAGDVQAFRDYARQQNSETPNQGTP